MTTDDDPLVFVEKNMFDGVPVLTVYHELDGDWQYLTSLNPSPADAQMVHQSHVYATDPSLKTLHSMPKGTWAARAARGEPWTHGLEDPET